ncbi:Homeobox protein BEL1-like protein [Dichanthelium oligosanthes]|uniref:Homeobox protein BEL1-like protein n=1 Tax=Dichanthelium oligosanthes TaxID=888268 RepID=A0A1E5VBA9_9POAL|nr:Homeobox protein BEL1-like protein [Dichanthelium oligosanthes]
MAHDPSLAYADYFAAAGGGVSTLVPEVDAGEDDDQLYGGVQAHHQHGLDMFGVRGLMPGAMVAAASVAHGKAALGDFVLGEHQRLGYTQAPLTSLSLHGPAEAASLVLHHHQLGGGALQQQHQQAAWHLRGSRFLRPTQQLLQEFCSLPVEAASTAASKPPTKPASEDGVGEGSSSSAPSAQIQAMDAAELQRLKAKLYAMLQEVERRYRRYREQMRAVAGSFEAVAGERAAAAYTRLASRTISKHFRSLRDGVAAQMQAVRRALGEKDTDGGPAAGMAKGETTPRLRVLDQCLRQHRTYQAGVLESQPWRPQRGLPERAVSILRAWLFEHFLHPYPSDVDKHILARQTGLSRSQVRIFLIARALTSLLRAPTACRVGRCVLHYWQVSNWFINARVRLWKPMVEEMYSEEMKDPQEAAAGAACSNANNRANPSGYGASELGQGRGGEDGGERKPTRAQLVHDAGSLASVVSIGSSSRDPQNINFGMMDGHLDFGAYNDDHAAGAGHHGFGGGVSLTLGLQQHADDPHGGVNVAFASAPSAAHEFLFMVGGQEQQMVAGAGVHGHQGQFGGGMEGDASHYHRGLSAATGFQLLRDLAG